MRQRHAIVATTLGPITIVATDDAITGLYFAQHARRPRPASLGPQVAASHDRLLLAATEQLTEYLHGTRRSFDLPLATDGDEFQRAVWDIVKRIACGRTTTYGAIAAELGDRSLAKEVGQAVGANPLCIFVPCHRVVGASGALTGYAGGLARKRQLLELEVPTAVAGARLF